MPPERPGMPAHPWGSPAPVTNPACTIRVWNRIPGGAHKIHGACEFTFADGKTFTHTIPQQAAPGQALAFTPGRENAHRDVVGYQVSIVTVLGNLQNPPIVGRPMRAPKGHCIDHIDMVVDDVYAGGGQQTSRPDAVVVGDLELIPEDEVDLEDDEEEADEPD